ncbi:hypothetical protein AB434_1647 [Heyndrickxia coagulans]|uniref:Uncharacterized protein n=1 Tax=Heyndrickxia coagulans TaxID=1398 RepID=A0AAN0T9N7_HEYCO|nr:hypothetical protein SB48_HM08orf05861 [Heyndrickxia coagulans]AKN54052.1 hypothetical protein AB434_1647 [Heyndrickxia coagulans]
MFYAGTALSSTVFPRAGTYHSLAYGHDCAPSPDMNVYANANGL